MTKDVDKRSFIGLVILILASVGLMSCDGRAGLSVSGINVSPNSTAIENAAGAVPTTATIGRVGQEASALSPNIPYDNSGVSSGESAQAPANASMRGSNIEGRAYSVDEDLFERYAWIQSASPRAKSTILKGLFRSDRPLSRYGIDDNLNELFHFLSQSATETFGFRTLSESTSYSAERLREVFPARVSADQAQKLARKPRETANHVYGTRLGNIPGTDDGWNFRGSGYLQLTGRDNFARAGNRMGISLVSQPDGVRQPALGLDASLEYWVWRGVDEIAETGDVRQVRYAINGGTNGLAEANVWFQVIKKAFETRGGTVSESGAFGVDPIDQAVALALADLGFLNEPEAESTFTSSRYSKALAEFQRSRDLEPTGIFDVDTLYKITDPDGRFNELE